MAAPDGHHGSPIVSLAELDELRARMRPALRYLAEAAVCAGRADLGELVARGMPRDLVEAIAPEGTPAEDGRTEPARELVERLYAFGDRVRRAFPGIDGLLEQDGPVH